MRQLRRPRPGLFWKVSAIVMFLLVILGTLQLMVGFSSARWFVYETDQKLNKGLAADLAAHFRPHLEPEENLEAIAAGFHDLMVMNPRVELYLLNSEGEILAFFADPERVKRKRVSVEPIRSFLGGEALPILGEDPRNADRRKPFSVSKVSIAGESGFLYIILGGEDYDSVSQLVAESSILSAGATSLLGIFAVTAIAGFALIFLVTRRVRRMQSVVEDFQSGDLSRRFADGGSDEIAVLGNAFNRMADSIAANLEALEQSDSLRRELVANISHDLRSPLASAQGYVETILIKDDQLSPEDKRAFLETVFQTLTGMRKLVEELFELARLEAKQHAPRRESFQLAELAQDMVVQFQPLAERHNVEIVFRSPTNLPRVSADIGLIERAIGNLLDNAVRYAGPAGHVEVFLVCDRAREKVELCVADDGPGIPAEDLGQIFDRFYRVDKSRSRNTGGSGLGLAIARQILRAHDSDIVVESTVGKGTTFRFFLPAAAKPSS